MSIFVPREFSAGVVKTLSVLGHAYVVKTRAGTDLLGAVEASSRGQAVSRGRFVGRADYRWLRLSGHHMVPDGVLDQFGVAFGAKHLHHPVFVIGHRPGRHVQNVANLFHHLAFG